MHLVESPQRHARAEAVVWSKRPPAGDPFADRRLMARAGFALLLANVRYWSTVAPLVRVQLCRWERHAGAIPDPLPRALAITKLREERFNAEVAATLATLAGRAHRGQAVRAIVALQVMYDYLDLLTEQPLRDPLADGRRLFGALVDALPIATASDGEGPFLQPRESSRGDGDSPFLQPREPSRGDRDSHRHRPRWDDGGYLRELARTVRLALAGLPAAGVAVQIAQRSAQRCAEAQVLGHAAARCGTVKLERWARREAAGTALQWPELLAGAASSVIAVHALIAAAADRRTTLQEAEAIDAVYLSICALTMLDSLVDREHDLDTGELGYLDRYVNHETMALRLADLARKATREARTLPHAAHHIATLVGVVAYYTSAPTARSAVALPVTVHLRRELRPLIGPTLALMRTWRLAKRVRRGGEAMLTLRR